jgi:hypothetical protein
MKPIDLNSYFSIVGLHPPAMWQRLMNNQEVSGSNPDGITNVRKYRNTCESFSFIIVPYGK